MALFDARPVKQHPSWVSLFVYIVLFILSALGAGTGFVYFTKEKFQSAVQQTLERQLEELEACTWNTGCPEVKGSNRPAKSK